MSGPWFNFGPLLLLLIGGVLLLGPYFALRGRGRRGAVAGLVIGVVLVAGLALVMLFVSVSDARVRRAALDAQIAEIQARNEAQMKYVMSQVSGSQTPGDTSGVPDASVDREYRFERTLGSPDGARRGKVEVRVESDCEETADEPPPQTPPSPPRPPRITDIESRLPRLPSPPVYTPGPSRPVMQIGGLVVLIVLAYLFIDAGRRPRYTWLWRVGIAAVFFAVCGLLAHSRYAM
jgi:hypothetical protein